MPQPRLPGFESGGSPPRRFAPAAARRPRPGADETAGGPEILLYADGACSGNPGPGGWAAILVNTRTGEAHEISGSDPQTTNNRMELTAVIAALRALPRPSRVRVITDSRYVVDGMREWLPRWLRNGWKTSDRKPVKNRDLWEDLSRLDALHTLEFTWIEGHSGHPENERCDRLAVEAYRRLAR